MALGGSFELFLPVWTPGSYLVREHARHLRGFSAVDLDGDRPIPWRKTTKNRFRLEPRAGCQRVRVTYDVYCHELTVRTADLTSEHAFWNGACVYLWPVGATELLARMEVLLPRGWRFVTQLAHWQTGATVRIDPASLDALVDSPCLAGDLEILRFEAANTPHTWVLDGLAGVPIPESLVPDTQRIVEEAGALFGGELPYDHYHFLGLFTDAGRGGLEHDKSAALLAPRTTFKPRKNYENYLGLVAHELMHAWNGRRMRPAGLARYDYEGENYTSLLWVVEGMTSYYDDHLCLRARILTSERYLALVADNIATMQRTPGRLLHPLSAASFDAWIKFYRPDENSRNSSQSYYTSGALAAMCFDLKIRDLTNGRRSLDDAIADLYRRTASRSDGYREDDVLECLNRAAGTDLSALKRDLIDGPFDPPLSEFFAPLGLRLALGNSEAPHLGLQFRDEELRVSSVLSDGPAMLAGVAPGDEVLAVGRLRVTHANWSDVIQNVAAPEKALPLLVARRGKLEELVLHPTTTSRESVRIEPIPGASRARKRLREGWLWEG